MGVQYDAGCPDVTATNDEFRGRWLDTGECVTDADVQDQNNFDEARLVCT